MMPCYSKQQGLSKNKQANKSIAKDVNCLLSLWLSVKVSQLCQSAVTSGKFSSIMKWLKAKWQSIISQRGRDE